MKDFYPYANSVNLRQSLKIICLEYNIMYFGEGVNFIIILYEGYQLHNV